MSGQGPTAMLAIAAVRRDGGTQPRDHISLEIVKEYANAIVEGAAFPPVTTFYDGTSYWLADGFHRVEAHVTLYDAGLLKVAEIAADVRQGDRRDAILFSVGANASHGYRRNNMDKRRAVLALLNDPEWATWSDREIARRCHVSNHLVAELRPAVTGNSPSDEVRTFLDRHGNASHMRVAAIGKRTPELPIVAGKRAERKPRPEAAGMQEVVGVASAAEITGLSDRHVKELARDGGIKGAEKESGVWYFPTVSLKALVEESTAVAVADANADLQPHGDQASLYDPAVGQLLLAISDTVELIANWPAVDVALAHWARDIGGAPDDAAITKAAEWMANFAARWPAASAERSARIHALVQGDLAHVA